MFRGRDCLLFVSREMQLLTDSLRTSRKTLHFLRSSILSPSQKKTTIIRNIDV